MGRFFWVVVVPLCAAALAVALFLTSLLVPRTRPVRWEYFLPEQVRHCRPEPREQAGYLVAVAVVSLLVWGGACWACRRSALGGPPVLDRWWVRLAALGVQGALAGLVLATVVYQELRVHPYLRDTNPVRALVAVVLLVVAWRVTPVSWTRWLRALPPAIALGFTVVGLLPSLYRERQPAPAVYITYHLPFQLGEFAAVLNGRTPWVDYFPQYQTCLGYALAPVFRLTGLTVFSFTAAMGVLSAASLLVFFFVFRRVTGGGWKALALYLPLLAVSLAAQDVGALPWHQRVTAFNYYAVGPLRYFGPCMTLACLTAFLVRPGRLRLLVLAFVATLTAVNNLDFGVPALAAAVLAVLLSTSDGPLPSLRTVLDTLRGFAGGGALAMAAFLLLTFVRSGHLPDLRAVTVFQRAFVVNGFNMLPMPPLGLHLVFFLTFMAALARALFAPGTRLRKGLLLYGGVFGSGALMYYVGRSDPQVLQTLFLTWAFPVLLLAWTCWEELPARIRAPRGWALSAIPALLLTAGYVVLAAQVERLPNLRHQVERLTAPETDEVAPRARLVATIRHHAAPGEKVATLHGQGHLAAVEAGVEDVFPYTCEGSLILRRQLDVVLQALARNRVRWVFGHMHPQLAPLLVERGYRSVGVVEDWEVWQRVEDPGGGRNVDGL
jgi:hypothetical protein